MFMKSKNKENSTTQNTFSKKVGRATYNVKVYFSKTSKENFNDKILRLIKIDIANGNISAHENRSRTT